MLLAACSTHPDADDSKRISPLLEQTTNWDAVLRLADQHGTSSLLLQKLSTLPNLVPPAVLASLREQYQRNIHKSLFLTRELIRILDHLNHLGIDAIPYKGVVLSEVYYGDMAMRQSGDVDIFIQEHHAARAMLGVEDLGFTARAPIPKYAEANYIASGYEFTFDSPAGKNLLELQWSLQPRFYAVDFDMDGLFQRAVTVELAGVRLRTPSPEDLLIVLSVHAAKHVWGRLIWLCDIVQILKRDNLNWDWVQRQAQELGIERILHITLVLGNRLLSAPIPKAIEKETLTDKAAQVLAEEIILSVVSGTIYEEEKMSYFRLMMRLRERRSDRLRFFTRLAFTPGPGEWDAVRLPMFLFPLYRVVRLARLGSKLARGLGPLS